MPIRRISDQSRKTIEQFFLDVSKETNSVSAEIGNASLALISEMNAVFVKTTIWALTSHYSLVLLSENDGKSKWYVTIACHSDVEIHIEYVISTFKNALPGATGRRTASSIKEAMDYVLIAMKESGGWPKSEELKDLTREK